MNLALLISLLLASCSQTLLCWTDGGKVIQLYEAAPVMSMLRDEWDLRLVDVCVVNVRRSWRFR